MLFTRLFRNGVKQSSWLPGRRPASRLAAYAASRVTAATDDAARAAARPAASSKPQKDIALISDSLAAFLFEPGKGQQEEAADLEPSSSLGMQLPALLGADIGQHFERVAERQAGDYLVLLEELAREGLPKRPEQWRLVDGWTRYGADGAVEAVAAPRERALVFDVEVCVLDGVRPTLAVAASAHAWYSWCSGRLVAADGKSEQAALSSQVQLDDLIPLEEPSDSEDARRLPRIVVGHSVGFDRARVREQFYVRRSATRFWDTLAMHNTIAGVSEFQLRKFSQLSAENSMWSEAWKRRVSVTTGLGALHRLHCPDSELELCKNLRQNFITGSLLDIRSKFQSLAEYCSNDVVAAFDVFQTLLPKYREHCPSMVTFAGLLEAGMAYLPVNQNWWAFVNRATEMKSLSAEQIRVKLLSLADKRIHQLRDGYWKLDPWMWDEDWHVGEDGKPRWYTDFVSGQTVEAETRARLLPKLLRLTWNGYPLLNLAKLGWGYLTPCRQPSHDYCDIVLPTSNRSHRFPAKSLYEASQGRHGPTETDAAKRRIISWLAPASGSDRLSTEDDVVRTFWFTKLPSDKGVDAVVKDPLDGSMTSYVDSGVLQSADETAVMVGQLSRAAQDTLFWHANRQRVHEQVAVSIDALGQGAVVPQFCAANTATRRATSRPWINDSTPKQVGSEVRSMVTAPRGRRLVGADLGAVEMWIAALLADAAVAAARPGCAAYSRTFLQSDNADSSDMHSQLASQLKVDRDRAKHINYGRLYGSSSSFAGAILSATNRRAHATADRLFAQAKGTLVTWRKAPEKMNDHLRRLIGDWAVEDGCYVDSAGGVWLPEQPRKLDGIFQQLFVARRRSSEHLLKLLDALGMDPKSEPAAMYKALTDYFDAHSTDRRQLLHGGTSVRFLPVWHYACCWLSESALFNRLSELADADRPRTPFLGCQITDALAALPDDAPQREEFLRWCQDARIYWMVQSSGVDLFHCFLTHMWWLCDHYSIDARFCLNPHAQVRYLASEADVYRCALALQISNLFTRAFMSDAVGMRQIPQDVALVDQISIDRVMRKSVDSQCHTPSNPKGLSEEYGIKRGIAVRLSELLTQCESLSASTCEPGCMCIKCLIKLQ